MTSKKDNSKAKTSSARDHGGSEPRSGEGGSLYSSGQDLRSMVKMSVVRQ